MDAIRTALRARRGRQTALARALGISSQAVYAWANSTRRLPAHWAITVERLFGCSRYETRPDIFGDAPAPTRDVDEARP